MLDPQMTEPVLADPVHDAQTIFRSLLWAFSHPGQSVGIQGGRHIGGVNPASLGILHSLLDLDTGLWLSPAGRCVERHLHFHTDCRILDDAGSADFALIADAAEWPGLDAFNPGTEQRPDLSTTIILQLASLHEGETLLLSGPGIRNLKEIRVRGLPPDLLDERARNRGGFPLGVDLVLTHAANAMALPRTTRVVK